MPSTDPSFGHLHNKLSAKNTSHNQMQLPAPWNVKLKVDVRFDANLVDKESFREACDIASFHPTEAAARFIDLAPDYGVLCEIAQILLTRPVGRLGSRETLRLTALKLIETVLGEDPEHIHALCIKGQAFLSSAAHGGWSLVNCELDVIEEALGLFSRAINAGSDYAVFLRGRLLVTSTPLHGCTEMASEGIDLVKEAAYTRNIARAFVFLATCHEFPNKYEPFVFDEFKGLPVKEREGNILKLYQNAAERGDAAAQNDLGASVEMGYAGLEPDFDAALRHYNASMQGGYVDAFENLGKLYESGMNGSAMERVNMDKALKYFVTGAHLRSAHCINHIGQMYDKGGTLKMNKRAAEEWYLRAIVCAEDAYDEKTASAVLRNLVCLYVAIIKTNKADADECVRATGKLNDLLGMKSTRAMMDKVEEAMMKGIKERKKSTLEELVTSRNSGQILRFCRQTLASKQSSERKTCIKHLFGKYAKHVVNYPRQKNRKLVDD